MRRYAAAVLVAGVFVVSAGCGSGEADPDESGTASAVVEPSETVSEASVEPSPEPSLTPPVLPEEAKQQTPEGAVAFATWWFDTLNYATATGDTAILKSVAGPDCGTCRNYIDEIDSAYRYGGRMEGGVVSVYIPPPDAMQELGIKFPVYADSTETQFFDSSGAEARDPYPAESIILTFTALKSDLGWIVGGLSS